MKKPRIDYAKLHKGDPAETAAAVMDMLETVHDEVEALWIRADKAFFDGLELLHRIDKKVAKARKKR